MQGYAGPVQQGDMVVRANEVSPGITSLLAKQNRKGAQGIYELPSAKQPIPNYYNMALDNVQNEIRTAAQTVNAMAPEGERLAFINPEEEGILKLLGGAGIPEPITGIPSYLPISGYKGPRQSSDFKGSYKPSKPSGGGGGNKSKPAPKPAPKQGDQSILRDLEDAIATVSYTHLTLPTKRIV